METNVPSFDEGRWVAVVDEQPWGWGDDAEEARDEARRELADAFRIGEIDEIDAAEIETGLVSDSLAATDGDEGRILRVSGKTSPYLPAAEDLEIVVLSEDEFEWLRNAIATQENSILLFPELSQVAP